MCFNEFIRYGCGHRCIPVIRPCPLTTNIPTNPVCPKPAERPTLVTTMCPACARIIHTRWVEIITAEHQFMHERGVCGCDVKFPALQQPRMLTRPVLGNGHQVKGNGDTQDGNTKDSNDEIDTDFTLEEDGLENTGKHNKEDSTTQVPAKPSEIPLAGNQQNSESSESSSKPDINPQIDQSKTQMSSSQHKEGASHDLRPRTNDILRDNSLKSSHQKKKNKKKNRKSKKKRAINPQPHALAWNTTAISPFYDVVDGNGGSTDVAVRLSSQYGAEWIQDHSRVHEAGQCNCAVQFGIYKPHVFTASDMVMYGAPEGPFAPRSQMGLGKGADIARPSLPKLRDMDIKVWQMNETDVYGHAVAWPTKPQDYGFRSANEAKAWLDSQHLGERTSYPNGAAIGHGAAAATGGYPDAAKPDEQMDTNTFHLPYPDLARSQPPAALTTTFCSTVSDFQPPSPQARNVNGGVLPAAALMPEQSSDVEDSVPLVGWPLGAGPEGDSHSPAWDMCRLSRPRPTRTRSFCG